MRAGFATTPEPPYWAVIFTSRRRPRSDGYEEEAERMMRLALASPGCLGAESARNDKDLGITVSYWKNEASILAFKADADHRRAQQRGREVWYEHYEIRVARVERAYFGPPAR